MKKYDYLIVGAGLFGLVFSHMATKEGKKCLVIDKREHIGGNIYCENVGGILVHKYGAHIFHTSDKEVWDFVNEFSPCNRYTNSPVANFKGELYNMPFNMNTFYKLWGTKTPSEAKAEIARQIEFVKTENPKNLEEQALSLVGQDIYEKLIKGYTEKQWGRSATELPAFIIKRLPLRFTFDNNYFNDPYQGIPKYNDLCQKLLGDTEVKLSTEFFDKKDELENCADKIIFTGMIDKYFDYCYGELEYRSLNFETEILNEENFQGNAVVNFTEKEVPYTRIIEHKHFENTVSPHTVVTKEYPIVWNKYTEAYYPINDEKNENLYKKYKALAQKQDKVIFAGRLGEYKYYDMDKVIRTAMDLAEEIDG